MKLIIQTEGWRKPDNDELEVIQEAHAPTVDYDEIWVSDTRVTENGISMQNSNGLLVYDPDSEVGDIVHINDGGGCDSEEYLYPIVYHKSTVKDATTEVMLGGILHDDEYREEKINELMSDLIQHGLNVYRFGDNLHSKLTDVEAVEAIVCDHGINTL